ncbi:MAG: transcriptional repressor [Chloroflexota bacterium]
MPETTERQTRLKQVVAKLREQGHRMTPQRMAVLEILIDSTQHPGAEQVYEQVRKDFPMTSLATIYKTLIVLKEVGEISEIVLADGSNRYDGNIPHPHPHLICNHCHRIIDVDLNDLSTLPQVVAQQTGYQIVSHRLDFFGICPRCQEEG